MDVLIFKYSFITVKFFPFLLLYFYIFFKRPSYLILLYLASTIFQSLTFINIDISGKEIKIPHYHFIALMIVLRIFIDIAISKITLDDIKSVFSNKGFLFFSIFVFFALFGSFVMPRIFEGTPINYPHDGIIHELKPLHWSIINLGQAVFLTISYAVVLYAMLSVRRIDIRNFQNVSIKVYEYSTFFVVILGVFQLVLRSYGHYLCAFLFDDSDGAHMAMVGDGISRINGTFNEPSYLVVLLAPFLLYSLLRLSFGKITFKYLFFSILTSTALFATDSTSWYGSLILIPVFMYAGLGHQYLKKVFLSLCLIFFGGAFYVLLVSVLSNTLFMDKFLSFMPMIVLPFAVFVFCCFFSWYKNRKYFLEMKYAVTIFLLIILAGLLFITQIDFSHFGHHFSKISAENSRIASDIRSWYIFLETYMLGVGIGSHRNSSFLLYMLSSVGIVGTFLFAYYLYLSYKSASFGDFCLPSNVDRLIIVQVLIFSVFVKFFSSPDLVFPSLWALIVLNAILNGSQNGHISCRKN